MDNRSTPVDPYALAESARPGYLAIRPPLFEGSHMANGPVLVSLRAGFSSQGPRQLWALISDGKIVSLRG